MARQSTSRRRTFLKGAAGVAAAGITAISGCLGEETTSLRVGNTGGEDDIFGSIYGTIKERVEEETDGQLELDVFWDSELGSTLEIHEGVSSGSIDMVNGNFAMMESLGVPNAGVLTAPYIAEDLDQSLRATDFHNSDVAQEFNESMIENIDIRTINTYVPGPRNVSTTSPVRSPEDYNGMSIRVPESDLARVMMQGMGATPQLVDWAETPQALATGVVDGVEQFVTFLATPGIMENTQYLIQTSHKFQAMGISINEESYQNLDDTHQDVLNSVVNDVREEHKEDVKSATEDELREIEESGTEIISEEDGLEVDVFEERVTEAVLEAFPDYEPFIERLREAGTA